MNKFLNLTTTALFVSLAIFVSCGGGSDPDPEPSAQEVQAALLTGGAATVSSVTLDGTAVAGWENAVITFSGTVESGTVGMQNSQDQTVFPTTTSWAFSDGTTTTSITRGDGVIMTVSASTSALSISFPISTAGARVAGIDGNWSFNFTR